MAIRCFVLLSLINWIVIINCCHEQPPTINSIYWLNIVVFKFEVSTIAFIVVVRGFISLFIEKNINACIYFNLFIGFIC